MPLKETDIEKERVRMAGLCAKSEQCEADIKSKLLKTTLTSAEICDILDFLKENKFIDHRRYAGSFVRDKIKFAKWGRIKIRYALKMKGIKESIFLPVLEGIDMDEYLAGAVKLIEAKGKKLDLRKREDIAKVYRYMTSKGFESSIISMALKQIK